MLDESDFFFDGNFKQPNLTIAKKILIRKGSKNLDHNQLILVLRKRRLNKNV